MTQTPPAGDGPPQETSENSPEQDGTKDRSEIGSGSVRPTDDELLQHLGRGGAALLERAVVLLAAEDSGTDE
jgi:hypothetical protein